MSHQQYIDQAVKLASDNVKNGGKPFGAVIVKNNEVVATGVNEASQTGDITSHAELEAIRAAGRAKNNAKLRGATLFASGHPCPMCLSACYLAGIKEIYYAGTLEEAKEAGLGVGSIYNELQKNREQQSIPLRHLASKVDSDPMQSWQKRNN